MHKSKKNTGLEENEKGGGENFKFQRIEYLRKKRPVHANIEKR